MGAQGTTCKQTTTKLKISYRIPNKTMKHTLEKINNIAIQYSMTILLHKQQLENNQFLPTTHDPP